MNTNIVYLQNPALNACIQCFIFFDHDSQERFSYQTFPNTNLCLTIYKNNIIDYKASENTNLCSVGTGRNSFSSRLFGFHERPFNVDINSSLDQVCILFCPGGLREFTGVPYSELLDQANVFECVFGNRTHVLENIFMQKSPQAKAVLLEGFLAERQMKTSKDPRILFVLDNIYKSKGDITVYDLSRSLKINESTLYRSFMTAVGQSPKDFIQTVRFRNVLKLLLERRYSNLTELTYMATYYDQSHFIKDFKIRSGALPNALCQKIEIEQHMLAWVIDPLKPQPQNQSTSKKLRVPQSTSSTF